MFSSNVLRQVARHLSRKTKDCIQPETSVIYSQQEVGLCVLIIIICHFLNKLIARCRLVWVFPTVKSQHHITPFCDTRPRLLQAVIWENIWRTRENLCCRWYERPSAEANLERKMVTVTKEKPMPLTHKGIRQPAIYSVYTVYVDIHIPCTLALDTNLCFCIRCGSCICFKLFDATRFLEGDKYLEAAAN